MNDAPKPRRFYPTPDRLIIGLLVVECLLWLSERFQYPTWHKGYAVLTAVAAVGVAFLVALLWLFVTLIFHWRFQFSIRSLLILTVAVAVPCSWFVSERQKARAQQETATAIEEAGGQVFYDYQLDDNGNEIWRAMPPIRPTRLRVLLDDDYFRSIASVDLFLSEDLEQAIKCVSALRQLRRLSLSGDQVTDATLENLKGLTKLRWLFLEYSKITDKGLECLKGMTEIEELSLSGTQVTDDGLLHLEGLPHLRQLDLANTKVTDSGLENLKVLTQLRSLELGNTKVTGDGAIAFRRALPDCKTGGALAHDERGCALSDKRKYDEAIAEFNEALMFDPDYAFAHNNRGVVLDDKEYDKALADFDEAIRLNPSLVEAYSNRGDVWREKKEYAKALDDLDYAINLNPSLVEAYNNRGIVWTCKKEYTKALGRF